MSQRIPTAHPGPPSSGIRPKHSDVLARYLSASVGNAHSTVTSAGSSILPGFEMPFTLQTGGIPTSVVTADFNRDGRMDFAVANGLDDNIWVYLGNGDGTFGIPRVVPLTQGVSPVWMAAADLRGNGVIDLITADIDSASVGVFLGNGDGTFSYEHFYDAGGRPAMMAAGDFNGDGKKDLFLDFVDYTQSSFVTLLGDTHKVRDSAPVMNLDDGSSGPGDWEETSHLCD